MEKSAKSHIKHLEKQRDKPIGKDAIKSDSKTIYVGDDTGLLKKISLKIAFEDLVISEPS